MAKKILVQVNGFNINEKPKTKISKVTDIILKNEKLKDLSLDYLFFPELEKKSNKIEVSIENIENKRSNNFDSETQNLIVSKVKDAIHNIFPNKLITSCSFI